MPDHIGIDAGHVRFGNGARRQQGAGAVGRIDRAAGAGVLEVVALMHLHRAEFEHPIGVEAMVQVQVQAAVGRGLPVPLRAQVGAARQADIAAVGVTRQAAKKWPAFDFFVAGGQADLRLRRDAVIQRAVIGGRAPLHTIDERALVLVVDHAARAQGAIVGEVGAGIQQGAIAVPGACLQHHAHAGHVQRALAHQVHRTAGVAGALQQAGGAAQHFGTVVDAHVGAVVAGAAIHAAIERHAVVLHGGDVETARIDVFATLRALHDGDAGGAGQRVVDRGDVLLVHQLAGDHADRLRDVLQALLATADADRTRGIAAGAAGGGAAFGLRGDFYRRQQPGIHFALAGHRRRRRAQHVAAGLQWHGLQATAGQHRSQRAGSGVVAVQPGGGASIGLRSGEAQQQVGRAGQAAQGRCQRPGRDAVALPGRGRGLGILRGGSGTGGEYRQAAQGQRNRRGDGPGQCSPRQ